MSTVAVKDFVTVVSVDGGGRGGGGVQPTEDSFVTVLSIGEDASADGSACGAAEEVLVYRLPGERLGFGLRFDGVDTCNRLFVQSCADGSPASRTQASWGPLAAGDEIVRINGRPVNRLSRDDCVRCLKESGLVVKLHMVDGRLAVKAPPPVPPRKQKKPEPPPPVASSTLYTDAVERLFVYHGESESDDTNSSVSTVVSKCPAESSSVGEDCVGGDGTISGGSDKNCVLDRVLEPFMQLEREFSSSATIGDDVGLYEKLVAVAEEDRLPPKPLPRKEVRPPKKKPPPPPPPLPTSPPPPAYRMPPRLVDFVHKDEPPQTVVDAACTAASGDDYANENDDNDDVFAIANNAISRPTSDDEITMAEHHDPAKECDATPDLTLSREPDQSYSGGGGLTMKSSHSVAAEPSGRTDLETDSGGSRNFVTTMTLRRPISGRTDEVCNRSVRDKIAMFSRATTAAAGGEKKDSTSSSSSSSSSAYSTASTDSSPAASPKSVAYSTLPRKLSPQQQEQQQQPPQPQYSATARPSWGAPVLQTADHRRSQSLVEQPYSKYFNTMNAYAEMGRSSLNALIEQRRRSMSKLRGLVIPEKVVPGSGSSFGGGGGDGAGSGGADEPQLHPAAIPDLPLVINIPKSENDDDTDAVVQLCPPTKTYVNEPMMGTATRRANPVLRQSYVVVPVLTPAPAQEQQRLSSASSSPSSSSSSSSTSSSLNSSREELRHIHDERPLSSIKSSNKGSFKADSDEDSALSSSRSSTSLQQYSPVSSPLPQSQQHPPPLPSSSPPPPTANAAANHCSGPSASETGKRVLKAESVEAINRKNVLCSARISSGKPEPQPVSPSSPANNYVCKTEYSPNLHHYHQHHHQQHSDGPALKSAKSGLAFATGTAVVSRYTHNRMSSVESTTSDDSSMQYAVNAEPFGSISSLASSTSLISQQELQQLIDDANQTLEENNSGCYGVSAAVAIPPHSVEVTVVILHRDMATSSVGITLAGGADYETKEITVYKVLTGSPADKDGRIRKGDRILSINGKSMKGITHRESLAILKAPRSEVVLVISRCKSDTVTESVGLHQSIDQMTSTKNDVTANRVFGPLTKIVLSKDGSGLGFSLEGGKNSPTGDQPLIVKKIFTGGCAEQCGQILAGDELVSVNDIDVTGMSRTEAWNLMKRLENGTVTLCIRHVV